MKKKLECGCDEDGCICNNQVEVPKYVPDGSKVICQDCTNGHHRKIQPKPPKTTSMKRVHKDMFVQSGS